MKIVINRSTGGFALSDEARRLLFARKANHVTCLSPTELLKSLSGMDGHAHMNATEMADGFLLDDFRITGGPDQGRRRTDPNLVSVVEELGDGASGVGAKLMVIEIPDGVDWLIQEFDGKEQISTREEAAKQTQATEQSFSGPIPA